MATTFTQSLVTSHFLIPRLPQKTTMLLILIVDKLKAGKKHPKSLPKFVALSPSVSLEDMQVGVTTGNAQFYCIVNIYNGHYINLIPNYLPITYEHSSDGPHDDGMCRPQQKMIKAKKKKLATDSLWKNKMATKHGLKMQLQYQYWDGEIHWGKQTKDSTNIVPLNPKWVEQIWKSSSERYWMRRIGI